MIASQPLFIPLYFEAEEDLWQALQQIEPEKRSSFIKESLRQVLIDNGEELFKNPYHTISVDLPEIQNEDVPPLQPQIEVQDNEVEQISAFSLEDLFVQAQDKESEEKPDGMKNSQEVHSMSGYEYMMKHIIGTEEDESVLKLLREKEKKSETQ